MKRLVRLSLAALVIALGAPAYAQGGGGGGKGGFDPSKLPKPEEIKAKAKEYLEKAPEVTAEIDGIVKITYKQIPTDPKKIAEMLGKEYKDQAKGFDIEAALKQYAPQIQETLNEVLREGGTFEAIAELKLKSKVIKKGSYKMGFEFDGEKPTRILLEIPGEKKPLGIPLTSKQVPDLPELQIKCEQDKKKKEKFVILVGFVRTVAKTAEFVAKLESGAVAGGDKKSGGDKKPGGDEKKPEGEDKKPE